MLPPVELKLKQASAVLGVAPKDLQNLVQFKVLRPRRQDSIYWFNFRLLLAAKVAFYLKDSLGTSTELLARFTEAFSSGLTEGRSSTPQYLWFRSRPTRGCDPIEVRVPLGKLAKELKEQLPRAEENQDLPRGRKRTGWKRELRRTLETAARELSGVSKSQIGKTIRAYRTEKRSLPEITVGRSQRSS